MKPKLLIVSIELQIWRCAICLSDKLSNNQWLILSSINLALLFTSYFYQENTISAPSIAQDHSVNQLAIGGRKADLLASRIKYGNYVVRRFSAHEYEHRAFTHPYTSSMNSPDKTAPQFTLMIKGANFQVAYWEPKPTDYYNFGLAFMQDDNLPGMYKRFLPAYSPSNRLYAIQNEESLWRQAVFYAPLVLCTVQIFLAILAAISLYRKWAEGIQLKLSNEKLRLEIEKLVEERNKGEPKIIVTNI